MFKYFNNAIQITGIVTLAIAANSATAAVYSDLWGKNGEKYSENSPLQNYAEVGYEKGKAIPDRPIRVNVKDYGAKGDGRADDTNAFRKAIKDCPENGTVYVPAGEYKLTDQVKVTNIRNITLRGEDMYETVLFMPKGLEEIRPKPTRTTSNRPATDWSWSGGFIEFSNSSGIGIENFTFKFPNRSYTRHWQERGYNTIAMYGVSNSWLRNLYFYNADLGPHIGGANYLTATNLIFDGYAGRPNRLGRSWHHAMTLVGGSHHNLIDNIEYRLRGNHEMSVESGAYFNVFSRNRGINIEIDHHHNEKAIRDNLFTDIDLGEGYGQSHRNFERAFRESYWGVGPINNASTPPESSKNLFVGVKTSFNLPNTKRNSRPWYEHTNTTDISPRNIHAAQVAMAKNLDNLPPDVYISRPYNQATVRTGKAFTVTAILDDRDGQVRKGTLLINGAPVGQKSKAPFEWEVPASGAQKMVIEVIAEDNQGARTSKKTNVIISNNGDIPTTPDVTSAPDNMPTTNNGPAQNNSGFKSLVIKSSNKCVDVKGADKSNEANLEQYTCHGNKNQKFSLINEENGWYQIQAEHSGLCLDVSKGSQSLGESVIQWECKQSNSANQQFQLISKGNGWYNLKAKHSGLCLDIAGNSKDNNANLEQFTCNGQDNQLFKMQ